VELIPQYIFGLFTSLLLFKGSRNIIWAVFHGEPHNLSHTFLKHRIESSVSGPVGLNRPINVST
jgi:hypothetical protein